jgi:hypothetical protein
VAGKQTPQALIQKTPARKVEPPVLTLPDFTLKASPAIAPARAQRGSIHGCRNKFSPLTRLMVCWFRAESGDPPIMTSAAIAARHERPRQSTARKRAWSKDLETFWGE